MENLPRLEASGARGIASKLKSISAGKVLDVCTGEGDFISTLMQTLNEYENFVGIDMAQKDLETAYKEFEGQPVQFLAMDAEHLGFGDRTFDTVSISNSLHHLRNQEIVLAEMHRVLRPGGRFIIQEMYQDGEPSEAQITSILEHHWGAKIDRCLGESHHETLTQKEIIKLLANLKFKDPIILEASRYVKCLTCPERFECENPRSKKLIDRFTRGIDQQFERLEGHKKVGELRIEGEQLKERVKATGTADASFLFIIGKKDI